MSGKLPREEKMELRIVLKQLRDSMDRQEKKKADIRIKRLLLSLSSFRFSELVLLYFPIQSEVDIRPIMDACFSMKKKVLFPRCEKEPGQMTFRFVESLSELSPGANGVPEPSEEAPVYHPAKHGQMQSICLVPALAFDKEGYRLGYGKGYYDRFLGEYTGTSVGITYEKLFLDKLPRGYFDRKVEMVITEAGVKMSRD